MAVGITIERYYELLEANIASGGYVGSNEDVLVEALEASKKTIANKIAEKGGSVAGTIGGTLVGGGLGAQIGEAVGEELGKLAGKVFNALIKAVGLGSRDSGLKGTDITIGFDPSFRDKNINITAEGARVIVNDINFFLTGSSVIEDNNIFSSMLKFQRSDKTKRIESNKRGYLRFGEFSEDFLSMILYNAEGDYNFASSSSLLREIIKVTGGVETITVEYYLQYATGKYGIYADSKSHPYIDEYATLAGSYQIHNFVDSYTNTGVMADLGPIEKSSMNMFGFLGLFALLFFFFIKPEKKKPKRKKKVKPAQTFKPKKTKKTNYKKRIRKK